MASFLCACLRWFQVGLTAALVACSVAAVPGQADEGMLEQANPFTGEDLDGSSYTFNPKDNNKPALLVFWRSGCHYCVKELPELKDFHSNHKNIEFVSVSIDSDLKKLKDFVAKQDIKFRVIKDPTHRFLHLYGVKGTPALFLIDKNGKIKGQASRVKQIVPLLDDL